MKALKIKEAANLLLDLEILCKQHNIEDIRFKLFDKDIEFYEKNEILQILNDNFIGTIENHEEYGYDAGQKFVIKL